MVISRDVKFDEGTMGSSRFVTNVDDITDTFHQVDLHPEFLISNDAPAPQEHGPVLEPQLMLQGDEDMNTVNKRKRSDDNDDASESDDEVKFDDDAPNQQPTRRSSRMRMAPIEWWKASANAAEVNDSSEPHTF